MIFVNFVSSCGHWLVIWTIFHKSHWSGGKWLARPGCIVLHRIPCKHQQNISARTVSHQCSVSPWAAIVVSRKIVTIRNLCNCISVLFTTRQPRWLTLTTTKLASVQGRQLETIHLQLTVTSPVPGDKNSTPAKQTIESHVSLPSNKLFLASLEMFWTFHSSSQCLHSDQDQNSFIYSKVSQIPFVFSGLVLNSVGAVAVYFQGKNPILTQSKFWPQTPGEIKNSPLTTNSC